MAKPYRLLATVLVVGAALGGLAKAQSENGPSPRQVLRAGWMIQSSAQVQEKPEILSTRGFTPQGWYPASIPSTVLAALVDSRVVPDPYFGLNMRLLPGTDYPAGTSITENFSNHLMPPDSPYRVPWWYRTEFQIPAADPGKQVWLDFEGINYRANIWLNGRQIADSKRVAGAYRVYEFNITDNVKAGAINVLAVEVSPPQPDDLAINWVNVNPGPPDKNMGLWHEVYITTSGPVVLRHPQVVSRLDLPSLAGAHLTVTAELTNMSRRATRGVLRGQIADTEFAQPFALGPRESRVVTFTPERFPQLNLSHPRIWWPWQMGDQNLYELQLTCELRGQVSDGQAVSFGIRNVSSELTEKGYRLFRINGQKLLIRGAGWWSDMLLRPSAARQEAEIRYVKDMHLNAIRMDGKLEDENFLNLCDRAGILLLPGWCCCDHWERWKDWKQEEYTVGPESLRDQIRRFRNHPCLLSWLNADDKPPFPAVEGQYIKVLQEEHWPNPYLSSATETSTPLTGPTGVKMRGPYGYIPPSYWLTDQHRGGAFGFNTETSPGPTIPPIQSLRKFLPAEQLWPLNDYWNLHIAGEPYLNLSLFTRAMDARYGPAKGLEDFVMKGQVIAYEGERAMYEAYARNKYTSTGILRQMLNNAWPSVMFHLYDYYLYPGGGYFGTKKACEPLHIQYSYDDRSIVVVNSTYRGFQNLKARAEVYNLDLTQQFSRETSVDVPPDSSSKVMTVPELAGLSTAYFVRLRIEDAAGHLTSSNFYWLSTKPDVVEWANEHFYWYTPTLSFGDLSSLQGLPTLSLKTESRTEQQGEEERTSITLENPTNHLAFFVHLGIKKGPQGEEVAPILWEDNYFSLMPGERREVAASYRKKDLEGAAPVIEVEGWNVPKASLRP